LFSSVSEGLLLVIKRSLGIGDDPAWKGCAEEVGIVKCMRIDEIPFWGVMNDKILDLIRFDTLLLFQTNTGGLAFCCTAVMLDIQFEFDFLLKCYSRDFIWRLRFTLAGNMEKMISESRCTRTGMPIRSSRVESS
jgi:hypothetical protein